MSAAPARAVFDDATFYLRAVVEALRVPKAFALANDAANGVHYVVHVCPNSNKTSTKSVFDLLDVTKSDAIPAELKSVAPLSSDALLSLKKFTTTVAIDELIAFDVDSLEQGTAVVDEMTEKVLDAVQQQLLPLVQRVQSATGILRNRRAANSSGPIDVQLISAVPAATMTSTDDEVLSEIDIHLLYFTGQVGLDCVPDTACLLSIAIEQATSSRTLSRRDQLRRLRAGECKKPLRLWNGFVIKRALHANG